MKVAVVAHNKKTLGGGLPDLKAELTRRDHRIVGWHEVSKGKQVPVAVRQAVKSDPQLLLLWGGDGTVQRAVDVVTRTSPNVPVGVLPAGTSNLFAANLGIPPSLGDALETALFGERRSIDVGSFNGQRFVVMAGVGFDALMIADASASLKRRLGKIAYVYSGVRNLTRPATVAQVAVDGKPWFAGRASCVLVGNVGKLIGGLTVFHNADPTDGCLDVAVVHADRVTDWARLTGRALTGAIGRSPLITITAGRRVDVRLDERMPYELDGTAKRLKVRVCPKRVTVCVPGPAGIG